MGRKQLQVFYAWQTDLPSKTNRTFIEDCLNKALAQLNSNSFDYEFVLDKDTSGQMGTPEISDTILSKINDCYAFIGDVTIVNAGRTERPMPNPNVFFECGYAVAKVGWDRVIFLANKAFGNPDNLPFDIRHRRITTYDYKVPDLSCVDDLSTLSIEDRKTKPNILTKENGLWKFYIAKDDGAPRLEDYSSDAKFKAFIQQLNKKESTVIPSVLRTELVNELKGIINLSKQNAKKDLTKLFVDGINGIHQKILIDRPKELIKAILDLLEKNDITFIGNEYAKLNLRQLLSNLAINSKTQETIDCRMCISPPNLVTFFKQYLEACNYIKIDDNTQGNTRIGSHGQSYDYKITFLPEFFQYYESQSEQTSNALHQQTTNPQTTSSTQGSVTTTQTTVPLSKFPMALMPGNTSGSTTTTTTTSQLQEGTHQEKPH